ncbi:MAG: alpha/beta fold hydrolase [Kordiimonas sp.]
MISLRIRVKAALLSCVSVLLYAVSALSPVRAATPEGIEYNRCYIDNIDTAAQCFDLEVPLAWDNPDGTTISLSGAIIPAKTMDAAEDPLVILAGGPGQAATTYGALVERAFYKIRERRDIILVAQRGTGGSHALSCEFPDEFNGEVSDETLQDFSRLCAAEQDVDVRYFSSMDVLQDLEHVRRRLGVQQVNLWGGSYGTRLGLLYMKLYPESIRSAILDGVTSPEESLFVQAAVSAEAAWQKLVNACENDVDCKEVHPDLDSRLKTLLRQLEEQPVETVLRNPATGKPETVVVGHKWLAEAVRSALYVPSQTSIIPFALQRVEQGDYSVFGALAANSAAWASSTMTIGSTLSVLCREDVPVINQAEAERLGANSFHGAIYYNNWAALCANWPVFDVPEGYGDPIISDIPTLILSGALDPVTPPAMARVAEDGLSNVQHMIAENAGNNVSAFGCAPDIMADFIKAASPEGIDAACLNEPVRPAFVLTPAGSKP